MHKKHKRKSATVAMVYSDSPGTNQPTTNVMMKTKLMKVLHCIVGKFTTAIVDIYISKCNSETYGFIFIFLWPHHNLSYIIGAHWVTGSDYIPYGF